MIYPEWVHCVLTGQCTGDPPKAVKESWCGQTVMGFAFVDAAHAASEARREGRLQVCPECSRELIAAIERQAYTPDAEGMDDAELIDGMPKTVRFLTKELASVRAESARWEDRVKLLEGRAEAARDLLGGRVPGSVSLDAERDKARRERDEVEADRLGPTMLKAGDLRPA